CVGPLEIEMVLAGVVGKLLATGGQPIGALLPLFELRRCLPRMKVAEWGEVGRGRLRLLRRRVGLEGLFVFASLEECLATHPLRIGGERAVGELLELLAKTGGGLLGLPLLELRPGDHVEPLLPQCRLPLLRSRRGSELGDRLGPLLVVVEGFANTVMTFGGKGTLGKL